MIFTDQYWLGEGVFKYYGLSSLADRYKWPKNHPIAFDETVAMKLNMQESWSKSDLQQREELALYVIKEWGGIKGNSRESIKRYSELDPDKVNLPYKGVASYSKVLGIIDPLRFAILDARVVVSLNALQLIEDSKNGIFFPYLEGRNKVTGDKANKRGFSQLPLFQKDSDVFESWLKPKKDDVYTLYLDLMREFSMRLKCPLYLLEMSLFADAEPLAKQCARKFGYTL